MRGHGRLLRGQTPPQLVDQLLDQDGRYWGPDERLAELLGQPRSHAGDVVVIEEDPLQRELRRTRLTVQVGLVAIGALVASAIALGLAHLIGL